MTNDQAAAISAWSPRRWTIPSPENWKERIAHRDGRHARRRGRVRPPSCRARARGRFSAVARDHGWRTGESHGVDMPEPVYSVGGGANTEFDTEHLPLSLRFLRHARFGIRLPPGRPVERKLAEAARGARLRSVEIPVGIASMPMARDGTRIPISLVYRIDKRKKGPQPLLLYGYGAYGYSLDVDFSSTRLSLLDRGVIFAMAHVRGGGEMGKHWHDQGRMLQQEEHLHRFHRLRRTPDPRALHRAGQAGDRRRQRGRPADGRGDEPAARPVPRGGCRGAVRGRDQHHARRHVCR